MGFCLECGEVTAQQLCFECFSRMDIMEADAELAEFIVYKLGSVCQCDKYPLDHGACPVCMVEEE